MPETRNLIGGVALISFVSIPSINAETITWNVRTRYGITQRGIARAIQDARAHFAGSPNDRVVLLFDAGTHCLDETGGGKGTIDLTDVKPGHNGRLVFKGAGRDRTTMIFNDAKHAIYGTNVYRVTFKGIHMTRRNYTVSQGHVVSVSPGKLVLDIQEGFPTPRDIFDPTSGQGRYLRRYTDSRTDPQLVQSDNAQIPWDSATHVSGRRWQMDLKRRKQVAGYRPGDLIGIKSKHGGQTYWLARGSDIAFEDVKWTHKTRGVFRGGIDKVRFTGCVTERGAPINGQTPCLASPAGGPQIGQPRDPPTSGNIVERCRFIASGDDAVAFFNATGVIRNCYITDAFARGILLANSPNAVLYGNTVLRCPVQGEHKTKPATQSGAETRAGP